MRYYGMTNEANRTLSPDIEEKPAVSVQPQTTMTESRTAQPTESRTFNRPDNQTGIYKGQVAQNVTSVREWLDEQPPAVMPPLQPGMSNPTIYEYPGGQTPVWQNPSMQNPSCQIKMDFASHLCKHAGEYAHIRLSDGMEKQGMIDSIGKNFITLNENGNHIMCPLEAVTSITILNRGR